MTALPTGHKLFMVLHVRLMERTGPVTLGSSVWPGFSPGAQVSGKCVRAVGAIGPAMPSGSLCRNLVLFAAKAGYRQTDQQTQRYQRALWVNRGPAQERPELKTGTSTAP